MCDYDLIGGGDPIGKIMLGWTQNKSYKPGFKHWKEALENPRRPIIKWHVLQVGGRFSYTRFVSICSNMFRRFVPRSSMMEIQYLKHWRCLVNMILALANS